VAVGAVIVILAVICYWPALHGEFIFDDDATLTGNALVQAPDGLKIFWTSTQQMDFWPVTYSTLWLEWRLWGMDSTGYHVTNLALHLAAVFLLWAALRRLNVPGAWLAALLFAVHPVNVEAVAWIAQRKTVLAVMFYFAAVLAFAKTGLADRETPSARLNGNARAWYAASVAAFILGMFSKGSVATAPLILLALIWWRRPVEWRDGRRLTPFFLIAGVLAAVNVWFQTHGSGEVIRSVTWLDRVLGAAAVGWFYLGQALAPLRLIFVYPLWDIRADEWRWWLPLVTALALTGLLISCRNTWWGRPALVAWWCFAAALVPVMGLVDIYYMKYALVADHYEYVALPAALALAAAAWGKWHASSAAARSPAAVVAATVVAALAFLCWRQAQLYQSAVTLYQATIAQDPTSRLVRDYLGAYYAKRNHYAEAAAQYAEAIRFDRRDAEAHNNLGFDLIQLDQLPQAVAQCEEAVRLRPDYAEAHNNLGNALLAMGQKDQAIAELRLALRFAPGSAQMRYDLGSALLQAGRTDDAIAQLQLAVQLDPDFAPARNNLGAAFYVAGRYAEAQTQFEAAVQLLPNYADALANLERVRARLATP
jgi:tetratricopeptide (TPR) repeat protein